MYLSTAALRRALRISRPVFASRHVSIGVKRKAVDAVAGFVPAPPDVIFRWGELAAVPALWIDPPVPSNATLLYLHGGAYSLGSADGYRGMVARLAAASRMDAVLLDYSRSPEAVYPTALKECLAAYDSLRDSLGDRPIVVAGDSAGGGLTLALAMQVRDQGRRAPDALGLICPWIDLVADVERTRAVRRDPMIVPSMITEWVHAYTGPLGDPRDPLISPLLGELSGLPPIVLHSAGDDPVSADAEALARRFAEADLSELLDHQAWPGLWHCFHLQAGVLRDADEAVRDFGDRLGQLVSVPVAADVVRPSPDAA